MAPRGHRRRDVPTFFTTHQVAGLLGVSITTVVNWTRQGRLKSQRTPGGHRRIALQELLRFAREHDYPLPPEFVASAAPAARPPGVLLVHRQRDFAQLVAEFLTLDGTIEVLAATDPVKVGFLLGRRRVRVVVVHLDDGEIDPHAIARLPWGEDERPVILASTTLRTHDTDRLVEEGVVAEVIEQTADVDAYVSRIRRRLER
ncbi:MAG: helix-turn-helix domain-containing protein [Deltaproteobacteria bacterium]|nr:MAG: helix-turn-helix domain-containing protein [Deltaproteobacteria bacterium]